MRFLPEAISCAALLTLIFLPMVVLNARDRRAERRAGLYRSKR